MPLIIFIIALLLSILWGVMFLRQQKEGLIHTDLDDKFTWGLYIQGFFFFSALAGGILIFVSVVTLFQIADMASFVKIGAAVSLSCLVAAGLLLASDLGKPFRGVKILVGKNFASPLTWDFYMISCCGLLNLLFLLDLIPKQGPFLTLWCVLGLIAALGFVMTHTLFFLSRVGAGFRSQPFLGLDTLAQSLWGGTALVHLIVLGLGMGSPYMIKLLMILTILVIIPLLGAHIAYLSNKRKGFDQKKILALDTLILIFLIVIFSIGLESPLIQTIAALLILLAVFLEKSHLIRQYQAAPTLPLPYSRYEETPRYSPSKGEWGLALGSAGICVLFSSVIIYFVK